MRLGAKIFLTSVVEVRLEQEALRVKQDMERLKKLELDQEGEAARARSDLDLERRVP